MLIRGMMINQRNWGALLSMKPCETHIGFIRPKWKEGTPNNIDSSSMERNGPKFKVLSSQRIKNHTTSHQRVPRQNQTEKKAAHNRLKQLSWQGSAESYLVPASFAPGRSPGVLRKKDPYSGFQLSHSLNHQSLSLMYGNSSSGMGLSKNLPQESASVLCTSRTCTSFLQACPLPN